MTPTQLAFQFMTLSGGQRILVVFGLMAVGGLIAVLLARPKGLLTRPSYFALTVLLHFGHTLLSFIADLLFPKLGIDYSMAGQVGTTFVLAIVFGFFWIQLAIARGRDLYGRGIAALIAVIPALGWLWLVFGPSRDEPVADYIKLPNVLRGSLAVLVGLAGMVGVYLVNQEEKRRMQPVTDFASQIEGELETMDIEDLEMEPDYGLFIKLIGLEATLQSIAEAESSGTLSEAGNGVLAAHAEGKTLTLVFKIAGLFGPEYVDHEFVNNGFVREQCEDKDYAAIFEAGGTLTFDFRGEEEVALTTVAINQGACDELSAQ